MDSLLPQFSWKNVLAVLVLSLGIGEAGQAQRLPASQTGTSGSNMWLTFLSDARLSTRWGLHTDVQTRRGKETGSAPQGLLRLGVNYRVAPTLQLTAGYAYASSYMYGDYATASPLPEHRIYQQFLLRNDSGRVHTQHRYRLEQRWVRQPGQEITYLNRMRYQLRLAVPLGSHGRMVPCTPYLVGANEIFIGFGAGSNRNFFDQNRAYLGLGYQFTKATALEVGYQHQMARTAGIAGYQYNHTLQLALSFHPDLRRGLPLASAL